MKTCLQLRIPTGFCSCPGDPDGKRGFKVTVKLNAALPERSAVIIPFLVRDKELIAGDPFAVSIIGVSGGKSSATLWDRFYMECDGGNVAGRTAVPGTTFGSLEKYDRSSGERSTKIFIQYGEELRKILGITVGVVDPVESNRIRVSAPTDVVGRPTLRRLRILRKNW